MNIAKKNLINIVMRLKMKCDRCKEEVGTDAIYNKEIDKFYCFSCKRLFRGTIFNSR